MATITAGAAGFNMSAPPSTATSTSQTITSTAITTTTSAGETTVFSGSFSSSNGVLTGTITSEAVYEGAMDSSHLSRTLSGLGISVGTYLSYANAGDAAGLQHYLFPGGDTYIGTSGTDIFVGFGGNDTYIGGSGTETFVPAVGANRITGGTGIDTVLFRGTSAQYAITNNGGGTITVADSVANRNGVDTISHVGNLQFADKTVFVANPDQANVARLYSAALGRAPDVAGLAGWETIYTNNVSAAVKAQGTFMSLAETSGGYNGALSIAAGFANSPEFQQRYGVLDDTGFVNLLYQNVLGRGADAAGLNTWLNLMHNGDSTGLHYSREMVLVGFAESPENVAKTGSDWLFAT